MSPDLNSRVTNTSLIHLLFSPFVSLRIVSLLSALSMLMLADGIFLLWVGQRIGGLPALAYSALIGIIGGILFALRAGAIKRKILEQSSKGGVQVRLVQQYGGMVVLLIPMVLPGIVSSGVALILYLPVLCRLVGWFMVGLNKATVAEVQQHLAW